MKRNELIPSTYLAATDFPRPEVVTIKKVYQDFIGQGADRESKTLFEFAEKDKIYITNKTALNFCFDFLADDSDAWVGKQVQVITPMIEYQGKSKPAIRLSLAPELTAVAEADAPF
jgi:hypothetical protein